jgi:NADH:ubiquinone oxidoreductase subunit E
MADHLEEKEIESAVKKFGAKKEALISILQEIQKKQGFLSELAVLCLSEKLDIPVSQIFGVASYYKAFSTQPQGKHAIQVCDGTSCHLKGGEKLLTRLGRELQIAAEGTSEDLQFSLKKVRCQGCCQVGPVIQIDDVVYGPLTQEKALKIIKEQK